MYFLQLLPVADILRSLHGGHNRKKVGAWLDPQTDPNQTSFDAAEIGLRLVYPPSLGAGPEGPGPGPVLLVDAAF